MIAQPHHYRRASWLCFAYLVASLVVLVVSVSSGMDVTHGGRGLGPSILLPLAIAGDIAGVAALTLLIIRRSGTNSNRRAALLAALAGLVLFGLATKAALTHPAAAPTGTELPGGSTVG
jgi:hypothetical protein